MSIHLNRRINHLLGLRVRLQALRGISLEVRDVQPVFWQAIHSRHQVPSKRGSTELPLVELSGHPSGSQTHLEVVSKRPVPKHLEEGVVV